jgi:hypothetical protein
VGGSDTSPGGTYIQGLSELDEFDARGIGAAQENGHLEPDSRGLTALHLIQFLAFLEILGFHSSAP